jgi:recombination protein RecA
MTQDIREKTKAVDIAIAQIEKQFGKGSIMKLGSRETVEVPVISTGALSIDWALGVGGLPRGRIIEIFGPESSGKTTLALQVVAEAQRQGGIAAFIDAEHAMDPEYSKKLGVDIDSLLVSQPDSGEQALEILEVLVRSGALDICVVDSVAALVPRAELEGEMGDSHVGLQARLMSQALRKLTAVVAKSKTCLVFINQIREKIGVMFGNPETTTGGRALKFYSSIRIDIRRIGAIKEGEETVGSRTKLKVVKNKVAVPFRAAEFDIMYGEGISRMGDLIDLGVAHRIIDKSGSWLSFGETRIGQGRENAKQFLRENRDIQKQIDERLRGALRLPGAGGAASASGEAGLAVADGGSRSTGSEAMAAAGVPGGRSAAPGPSASGGAAAVRGTGGRGEPVGGGASRVKPPARPS